MPQRASWWIGVLFAAGSLCFVAGPLPGFVQLVGATAAGAVFFAGSICFTAAAALQLATTPRTERADLAAAAVQFAGTLLFNVSTYEALDTTLSVHAENRVVWAPDALGSICFLVASAIAWHAVRSGPHDPARRIAGLNLAGSVLFGVAAVGAYVVPATGDVLALAAANFTTSAGALCFLAGALLLLPDRSVSDAGATAGAPASSATGRAR